MDHATRSTQPAAVELLEGVFGTLAKCHPRSWERRTYWLLVGTLYQRLAAGGGIVTAQEYAILAKAYAEIRRVVQKQRRAATASRAAADPEAKLPEQFAEVIRQVYGANWQASKPEKSTMEASPKP